MVDLRDFVSEDLFEIIKTHQLKIYYNKFLKPEEFIEYYLLSNIIATIIKFLYN